MEHGFRFTYRCAMIKAVLVDDEPAAAEVIQKLIQACAANVAVAEVCTDINSAVKAILRHDPDLLFLDIELADGLGFEVLEHFPRLRARVIFITAYDSYAIRAIKFNAFDYILKPIEPDELRLSVNKALDELKRLKPLPDPQQLLQYLKGNSPQRIAVPGKNGLYYYPIEDIIMIEGDGSYSIMHLENKQEVVVTKKIKDFEESLEDKGFLRVHKSYLVNTMHIAQLHRDDSGYLLMSNNRKVPISPKDKEEIIWRIKQGATII